MAVEISNGTISIRNVFRSHSISTVDVCGVSERGAIYKWITLTTRHGKFPVLASLVVLRPTRKEESDLRRAITAQIRHKRGG